MQLRPKFLVLKRADIEAALTTEEKDMLFWLIRRIDMHRQKQGKRVNDYVVINQDEPYFPDVLKLMETRAKTP